jgi:hypothetical protein
LNELQRVLGDRVYVLDAGSIEDYLPEPIYELAALSKSVVLERLRGLSGRPAQLREYKSHVARSVAEALTVAALDLIPVIRDAAQRAASLAE